MSDGAIRHASPHPPEPENKHRCGGCRLQAELNRLRQIEIAARAVIATGWVRPFIQDRLADLRAALEPDQHGDDPPEHPDDDRMRLEDRD